MKINPKTNKGFTLVEIMIVVVIIGLLAAMAIPAFQKVRENSQDKTITNNLRQIASGAQQHFLETGETEATEADIVGTDKYVRSLATVAGEDYGAAFPVAATQNTISVTTLGGRVVNYDL